MKKITNDTLVIIGASNIYGKDKVKNPFSFKDREKMLNNVFIPKKK